MRSGSMSQRFGQFTVDLMPVLSMCKLRDNILIEGLIARQHGVEISVEVVSAELNHRLQPHMRSASRLN
jgi:hypothetical protein